VSATGLGCMGMSDFYGKRDDGEAIRGRRDEVVLATKFGIVRDPNDPVVRSLNSKPEYVRKACEACL
jgi:aryl-alcohol dehydrogenase-like predicted oxidoreductase